MIGISLYSLNQGQSIELYTRYSYLLIVIYFKYKGKKALYYGDVMHYLGLPESSLPIAYFISGCDDSTLKLKKFGWKSALKLVLQQNTDDAVFAALGSKFPNDPIEQMQLEYSTLITCKNLVVMFIYS